MGDGLRVEELVLIDSTVQPRRELDRGGRDAHSNKEMEITHGYFALGDDDRRVFPPDGDGRDT